MVNPRVRDPLFGPLRENRLREDILREHAPLARHSLGRSGGGPAHRRPSAPRGVDPLEGPLPPLRMDRLLPSLRHLRRGVGRGEDPAPGPIPDGLRGRLPPLPYPPGFRPTPAGVPDQPGSGGGIGPETVPLGAPHPGRAPGTPGSDSGSPPRPCELLGGSSPHGPGKLGDPPYPPPPDDRGSCHPHGGSRGPLRDRHLGDPTAMAPAGPVGGGSRLFGPLLLLSGCRRGLGPRRSVPVRSPGGVGPHPTSPSGYRPLPPPPPKWLRRHTFASGLVR